MLDSLLDFFFFLFTWLFYWESFELVEPSNSMYLLCQTYKKRGMYSLDWNHKVTLTSNYIFQLQSVESCFSIDITPIEMFGKGDGKTILHNLPNAILNVKSSNDTQCSYLKKII